MLDHIGIPTTDFERSKAFFLQALAPLGWSVVMEAPGHGAGIGKAHKPSLWLAPGAPTQGVSPLHLAFTADDRAQVDAFYQAALAAGGRDNGPPGIRAHYHPNYYGAFVIGPDGHNVEAVCHAAQAA